MIQMQYKSLLRVHERVFKKNMKTTPESLPICHQFMIFGFPDAMCIPKACALCAQPFVAGESFIYGMIDPGKPPTICTSHGYHGHCAFFVQHYIKESFFKCPSCAAVSASN